MTIAEAMQKMRADKGKLSGLSVLNPEITAHSAWELIWRELVKLCGDYTPQTKLSNWLEKRVRQVCSNRFDPDLPDLTLPPMSRKITEPRPKPWHYVLPEKPLLIVKSPAVVTKAQPPPAPDVEGTPAPPKPKPFTRKFS